MMRRPPRSTLERSSAASDVYKRQARHVCGDTDLATTAQAALDSAIEFAPLQVRRDLILARVLIADLLATYEWDSLPTQRMNRHA